VNRTPNRTLHLLSILGKEIAGLFQRLQLAGELVYRGALRILLFLARSLRVVLLGVRRFWRALRRFFPRAWRFLTSSGTKIRNASRRVHPALIQVFRGLRRFGSALAAKGRDLLLRGRAALAGAHTRAQSARSTGDARPLLPEPSAESAAKRARRLKSFLVKEVLDIVQQPRLVVTLILGPFLILLIFGLGFTGKQGPATAVVVIPPDAQFPLDIEGQLARYKDFMPIHGIVDNREEALEELQARNVEIVAVLPSESQSTVLSGHRAVIDIYVDEYDPVRTQWLNYVSGYAAEDLNKQLLSMALDQGRDMLSGLQNLSTRLLDRLVEIGDNVDAGDVEEAKGQLDETLTTLDEEMESLEPSLQDLLNTPAAGESLRATGRQPSDVLALLRRVRRQGTDLRGLLDDPDLETSTVFVQIRTMRDTVLEVQSLSKLLASVPDDVLVSPVATEVWNESPSEPLHLNFYAPAVLALLLQHMAVTFGSLTMVRERLLGAEELFRIAPISPWEIITGKFFGYTFFTVLVGIVLSVLLVLTIKIPMLGNALLFLLTVLLMSTAALGWGIFVSLFSDRQSQAVQFTMLLLIAAVFFGGFFLALSSMLRSIRFVSYSLPVTYGVKALREIMLAGRGPGWDTLLPLAGMTVGFYVASVLVYALQNKRA
jgi:ABC-2 type transport system permease protein